MRAADEEKCSMSRKLEVPKVKCREVHKLVSN